MRRFKSAAVSAFCAGRLKIGSKAVSGGPSRILSAFTGRLALFTTERRKKQQNNNTALSVTTHKRIRKNRLFKHT